MMPHFYAGLAGETTTCAGYPIETGRHRSQGGSGPWECVSGNRNSLPSRLTPRPVHACRSIALDLQGELPSARQLRFVSIDVVTRRRDRSRVEQLAGAIESPLARLVAS